MARDKMVFLRANEKDIELMNQLEEVLQERNPKIKNRSRMLRYLIQKEASQLGVNVQRPYATAMD